MQHPGDDMNERYEEMYQAASRYYIQGETMESIAHQMGLSRSTVSRLLHQARTTGLVRISLADDIGSRSPMAAALNQAFGVRVHLVSVRDGIESGAEIADAVPGNAYELPRDEALPGTLYDAAQLLKGSKLAVDTFGRDVIDHHVVLLDHEWSTFMSEVSAWDLDRYFDRI